MTLVLSMTACKLRQLCLASFVAAASGSAAWAAPGAHGPDGEHLDGPVRAGAAGTTPRLEAQSELFELVANLQAGKLSIMIDRYETNEPMLDADVEVETGAVKAKAKFDAGHGDYSVDDPAFLKAVASPGEHALVFTIVAGQASDLLDGTLVSNAAMVNDGHGHAHHDEHGHEHELQRAAWTGAAVLGLGAIGLGAWLKQRKRERASAKGARR